MRKISSTRPLLMRVCGMNFGVLGLCLMLFVNVSQAASWGGNSSQTPEMYEKVRKALVTLSRYSVFDNLEYKIEGDTVTLYGQVRKPVLKNDAETAVKHVQGVGKVINQIEVLPLSGNDDQIRREAFRRIYSGPLARYKIQAVPPIHIIVKNGNITLTGVVATKSDSQLAEINAKQVTFAFSVANKLVVEEASK